MRGSLILIIFGKFTEKDLGSIPGTPYKEILFWKRALNPIEFITNQIKFIKNLL